MSAMHGSRGPIVRLLAVVMAVALLAGIAGCSAISNLGSGRDSGVVGPTTSSGSAPVSAPEANKGVSDQAVGSSDLSFGEASTPAGDVTASVPEADRLVIRNKTLRIEVKKVATAIDSIQVATKKANGVITNMQVATDSGSPIYRPSDSAAPSDGQALLGYVTVRVPADKFEAFTDEVAKLGIVRWESEASDDVTQQHVDLSARLENLRVEEKRLREFFAKAKDVKDMLAIEQELSRVRGEVESLDAQIKFLERQAAMATVTIDLNEPQPIVRPEGQSWGFGEAVTTGFRGAAGTIQLIIIVTITLGPILLIALVLFFIIRALVRKRRQNRPVKTSADTWDTLETTTNEATSPATKE